MFLASVPSVWQYEKRCFIPTSFDNAIAESDEGSLENITPVHWHIATMVVEEEKNGY